MMSTKLLRYLIKDSTNIKKAVGGYIDYVSLMYTNGNRLYIVCKSLKEFVSFTMIQSGQHTMKAEIISRNKSLIGLKDEIEGMNRDGYRPIDFEIKKNTNSGPSFVSGKGRKNR